MEFTEGPNHVIALSNDDAFTVESAMEMRQSDPRQAIEGAIEQRLEYERPFDQTVRLVTREYTSEYESRGTGVTVELLAKS